MESQDWWMAPSLSRHKPVIFALSAVALGCTLYSIREQIWSYSPSSSSAQRPLRRSNAVRQLRHPRRRAASPPQPDSWTRRPHEAVSNNAEWGSVPVTLDFLTNTTFRGEILEHYHFYSAPRTTIGIPLYRDFFSSEGCRELVRERGVDVLDTLRNVFMALYIWRHIPPSPITEEQVATIVAELERNEFDPRLIRHTLDLHQNRRLDDYIEMCERAQRLRLEGEHYGFSSQTPTVDDGNEASQGRETPVGQEASEGNFNQTQEGAYRDPDHQQLNDNRGQSLLNLAYHIAEQKARKEGYVHRRVHCDSCGATPIKGIRYRCANCTDYDLCEQCEIKLEHDPTHIFYKVRIPAPFLGRPRQPEPVMYPGKPNGYYQKLRNNAVEKLSQATGYQNTEIEALWEQFRCLAATPWTADPYHYNVAIDRRTFDKCFVPSTSIRPSPPNLVYDRIFAFYDQNHDGLIGFEEFVTGLAVLAKKDVRQHLKRIFKGFDIDDDNLVCRKDFLRMFRALYAAKKEIMKGIVTDMEEQDPEFEERARDIVLGSRPLSAAFTETIPGRGVTRAGEGKVQNVYGDLVIQDDKGTIDELDRDLAEQRETLGDIFEETLIGTGKSNGLSEQLKGIDLTKVFSEDWPPALIQPGDFEKVGIAQSNTEQTPDPPMQLRVRQVAYERLSRAVRESRIKRRARLCERRQRQIFYLDVQSLENFEDVMGPKTKVDIARRNNLVKLSSDPRKKALFRESLIQSVQELQVPINHPEFDIDEIFELLLLGWTTSAIVEDLSGFGVSPRYYNELLDLVADRLQRFISDNGLDKRDDGAETSPLPPLRRSRSSSKVRFQDEIGVDCEDHDARSATSMSSRGVPINERWGGVQFIEPEKDVGREVLYQVTQEAFNELLDPMFRPREDLALAEICTRSKRSLNRKNILTAVQDIGRIKEELRFNLANQNYNPYCSTDDMKDLIRRFCKARDLDIPIPIVSADETTKLWRILGRDDTSEQAPAPDPGDQPVKEQSNMTAADSTRPARPTTDPVEVASADLRNAIAAFDGAVPPSLEQSTAEKNLSELLEVAGYTVASSVASRARTPSPPPDPTLPQNRPTSAWAPNPRLPLDAADRLRNLLSPQQSNEETEQSDEDMPDENTLRFYAALDLLQAEDRERGGPGRLTFQEFEAIMTGERGEDLGFLASWLEIAAF